MFGLDFISVAYFSLSVVTYSEVEDLSTDTSDAAVATRITALMVLAH